RAMMMSAVTVIENVRTGQDQATGDGNPSLHVMRVSGVQGERSIYQGGDTGGTEYGNAAPVMAAVTADYSDGSGGNDCYQNDLVKRFMVDEIDAEQRKQGNKHRQRQAMDEA